MKTEANCTPRKDHHCRLCGTDIPAGSRCLRWNGITTGSGWFTSHAHPECYDVTIKGKWDEGDWESNGPGDIERPKPNEQTHT